MLVIPVVTHMLKNVNVATFGNGFKEVATENLATARQAIPSLLFE